MDMVSSMWHRYFHEDPLRCPSPDLRDWVLWLYRYRPDLRAGYHPSPPTSLINLSVYRTPWPLDIPLTLM